jgi:hypothetical protein
VVPGRWVESKWDALLGASGDHGLVGDLLWDDVREWFLPDGSLLDAYVFDTTVGDWQAFSILSVPTAGGVPTPKTAGLGGCPPA